MVIGSGLVHRQPRVRNAKLIINLVIPVSNVSVTSRWPALRESATSR